MKNKILKPGTYCEIGGIGKEVFDALVSVAVMSGYKRAHGNESAKYLEIKRDGFIYLLTDKERLYDGSKQLSLNDWLFSLAPDWVVDIRNIFGKPYYTDGWNKAIYMHDGNISDYDDVTRFNLIATRKVETATINKQHQTEEWQPKVGDPVSYPSGQGTLLIDEPDKKDVVIVKDGQGEYRRVSVFAIKPLSPEPTEEENIVNILSKSYTDVTEVVKCRGHFIHYAKALTKAGYRKVEPISKSDFCFLVANAHCSEELFKILANHNHIIIKGE